MKTAMQELEDKLKDNLKWIVMNADYELMDKLFKEAFEKENLQIELAHTTGYNDCYKYQKGLTKLVTPRGATEYYNQTYKPETI